MTTPRKLAAKNGEPRYEGGPCKTCGGTTRYTANATCVVCSLAVVIRSNKKFREAFRAAKEQVAA